MRKNNSYYSAREKQSKLNYPNTTYRKKNDDAYHFKNDYLIFENKTIDHKDINRNKNRYNITNEDQKKNDNSFNEDKDELKIRSKAIYSNRNYQHKFQNQNKFINIKDGDIQLFQKFKNKQATMKNNNLNMKRKPITKKNKPSNNKFNKTNQITNHLFLNNSKIDNNENMNSYINKNKPIRLNYNNNYQYDEMLQKIKYKYNDDIKKENEYDIGLYNSNTDLIQEKIDNLKNNFCFVGSNEEFIKYLKVVKMKAELTNLVEILFNKGEYLNEENAEECFYKLNNLVDYKNNEENNLLNGYKYLYEKLLEINNLNNNDIIN